MKEASFNVTTITFEVDGLQYSASGQTMAFDGYTKVYKKYEKQTDELLPEIEENEVFHDVVVEPKQHFTEPPARYTEARLIKELEENQSVDLVHMQRS